MELEWLDQLRPFDRWELSQQARNGLSAARYLQPFSGNGFGPGIRDLADSYDRDPTTIRRWISKARLELTRERRSCEDCDQPLPLGCRTSRRYCDTHATPAARTARHRLNYRVGSSARTRTQVHKPRPAHAPTSTPPPRPRRRNHPNPADTPRNQANRSP
jgi:hypothetical protein